MQNDDLESILKSKSINPTAIRLIVLRLFLKQHTAITLTQLEENLENTDRVTLYRTIKTFEKKGLVHSIKDGTVARYALCEKDCTEFSHTDRHIHYVCTQCLETYCLTKIKLPQITIPHGFIMEELNITAKGLCSSCS